MIILFSRIIIRFVCPKHSAMTFSAEHTSRAVRGLWPQPGPLYFRTISRRCDGSKRFRTWDGIRYDGSHSWVSNKNWNHQPVVIIQWIIQWLYPLVMTNIAHRNSIIDGLPFLKMGGSFHGYVTNNQMVFLTMSLWLYMVILLLWLW